MKLEAKFYSENNRLYFLDGTELDSLKAAAIAPSSCAGADDPKTLYRVATPWTQVGLDEDSYNEEFLAGFRDDLKSLEQKNVFVLVEPAVDSPADTPAKREDLVASFKHCARRIKDCTAVAGFAVPAEADADFFLEELSAKHKHYVFFSRDEELLKKNDKIVRIQ